MDGNLRPRVLYVDDHEDARDMLTTLLRVSLIETKAVATAAQALSSVRAERFDLYLLDVWLPDLDGFELCRRLRAFDPNTPVLFFSGAGYDADKHRGLAAGASDYVVKPDVEGLLGRIKQFIAQGQYAFASGR